jgi:hypothetical protein
LLSIRIVSFAVFKIVLVFFNGMVLKQDNKLYL